MDDTAQIAEQRPKVAMIAEHLTADFGEDGEYADEKDAALDFYNRNRSLLEQYRELGELLVHVTPDDAGTTIYNIVVAAESGEATAEWWGYNS